jgi:hypothetical protein
MMKRPSFIESITPASTGYLFNPFPKQNSSSSSTDESQSQTNASVSPSQLNPFGQGRVEHVNNKQVFIRIMFKFNTHRGVHCRRHIWKRNIDYERINSL